jgi:TonB family protein
MPSRKVQTGGFGDPNGIEHNSPPGNGKLVVASVGNFDLPAGGGYGNGTGGARGARGVVPSAGFGNGTVAEPRPAAQPVRVQATNFTPEMEPAKAAKKPAGPVDVPVAIQEKPTPIYTPEARQLHLEGEVLLEVVFTASGRVRVVRLLRGLGHGLDEAAMRAAEKIRFSPAQRDHQPVDTVATLHIVFQLS